MIALLKNKSLVFLFLYFILNCYSHCNCLNISAIGVSINARHINLNRRTDVEFGIEYYDVYQNYDSNCLVISNIKFLMGNIDDFDFNDNAGLNGIYNALTGGVIGNSVTDRGSILMDLRLNMSVENMLKIYKSFNKQVHYVSFGLVSEVYFYDIHGIYESVRNLSSNAWIKTYTYGLALGVIARLIIPFDKQNVFEPNISILFDVASEYNVEGIIKNYDRRGTISLNKNMSPKITVNFLTIINTTKISFMVNPYIRIDLSNWAHEQYNIIDHAFTKDSTMLADDVLNVTAYNLTYSNKQKLNIGTSTIDRSNVMGVFFGFIF